MQCKWMETISLKSFERFVGRGGSKVASGVGTRNFRDGVAIGSSFGLILVRVLEREGLAGAWVGHLPGAFHRDPVPSNRALYAAVERWPGVLLPAPIVRPDWPDWTGMLRDAVHAGAPAVRAYPAQWGLGPAHPAMADLAFACGEAGRSGFASGCAGTGTAGWSHG